MEDLGVPLFFWETPIYTKIIENKLNLFCSKTLWFVVWDPTEITTGCRTLSAPVSLLGWSHVGCHAGHIQWDHMGPACFYLHHVSNVILLKILSCFRKHPKTMFIFYRPVKKYIADPTISGKIRRRVSSGALQHCSKSIRIHKINWNRLELRS